MASAKLLVQRPGFLLGLKLKLTLQRIATKLVLFQGAVEMSLARIGPHQQSVDILPQRFGRQQAWSSSPDAGGKVVCCRIVRDEPFQHPDRYRSQSLALDAKPVFEWLLPDAETVEEVAAI